MEEGLVVGKNLKSLFNLVKVERGKNGRLYLPAH